MKQWRKTDKGRIVFPRWSGMGGDKTIATTGLRVFVASATNLTPNWPIFRAFAENFPIHTTRRKISNLSATSALGFIRWARTLDDPPVFWSKHA